MTAEEYFYNHWQKANRSRFGDYGDYDSDEYAIAFANDYAGLADVCKSFYCLGDSWGEIGNGKCEKQCDDCKAKILKQ